MYDDASTFGFFDKSSFYFDESDTLAPKVWEIINNSVDLLFLMDIIVTFNTSYYDEDFVQITDRGKIAKKYI